MKQNHAFDIIQSHPPFCHLSPSELDGLGRNTESKTFNAREKLYNIGDIKQSLMVIETGKVQISSYSPKGHPIELQTLGQGEIVGEVGFLTQKPHNTVAIATTPTKVLKLPQRYIRPLLKSSPQFLAGIIQVLCHRVTYYRDRHWESNALPLKNKLAKKLIQLSVMAGSNRIFTSQEALGHSLGSCRETIARSLRTFRNAGLLRTGHSEIEILNLEDLKKIASYHK